MSNFDFFNNKTEIIFHRKFINFQFYFWRFTIFFSWIIFPVLDMLKLENSCSDGSFWKILYKTSFFLISVKHQQTMKNNLLPVIFYPNIRFFFCRAIKSFFLPAIILCGNRNDCRWKYYMLCCVQVQFEVTNLKKI